MNDDLDTLCEIVDALAQLVERIVKDRPGMFAPHENLLAESVAQRARLLYRKRVESP